MTDSDGHIVWEMEYSAFGEELRQNEQVYAQDVSGVRNNIRFTGKPFEDVVGLYYFNARWYDAANGRFISEDPIRNGNAWYVYAANNPMSLVDPTGLYEQEVHPGVFLDSETGEVLRTPDDSNIVNQLNEAREAYYSSEANGNGIPDAHENYESYLNQQYFRYQRATGQLEGSHIYPAEWDKDIGLYLRCYLTKQQFIDLMKLKNNDYPIIEKYYGKIYESDTARANLHITQATQNLALSAGMYLGAMGNKRFEDQFPFLLAQSRLRVTTDTAGLRKTPANARMNSINRAAKFSDKWGSANVDDAINQFVGKNYDVSYNIAKGKIIYNNPNTGVQVVHDYYGNYFRIQNTNLAGKRVYMDLTGNIPNNKILSTGKIMGNSQAEYNALTHFFLQ